MTKARLWLPILLGLVAGGAIYVSLSRAAATTELVAIRISLKPHEVITKDNLISVPVKGDPLLFAGTLPYANRDALVGKRVRDHKEGGALIFKADICGPDGVAMNLLPKGYSTLALQARKSAVASQPNAGDTVKLSMRLSKGGEESNSTPAGTYGPYVFLGSYDAAPTGNRAPETVWVILAIPSEQRPEDAAVRSMEGGGVAEQLLAVNVVRQ